MQAENDIINKTYETKILFSFLVSVMLLSLTTSCGKDEEEQNSEQGASVAPIIVTVDANGNADGGHRFVIIDETNFYIDDIKYTATKGDLIVSGYNNAFFKGEAKIISQLNYVGREMHVVEIKEKAFYECTSLTSVTIPSSVTRIGMSAFLNCTSLTSVTIGKNVTSIGLWAFNSADISTIISLIEEPFAIGGLLYGGMEFSEYTFNNATLYVPHGTIDKYKATQGWKDFANIVEGNPSDVQ